MKNLLEEGFDVTGFDKNAYLGGLWHYNEDATISVLKSEFQIGKTAYIPFGKGESLVL